jgi:carbon storage regulator
MLVLTRKSQETIRIGDDITISILKVKGRAVRVGIEAPGKVRVVRGELADSQQLAAHSPGEDRETLAAGSPDEPKTDEPARALKTSAPMSTQNVNRILATRRHERPAEAPLAHAFRAATRSAAWDKVRHLSVG